MVVCLSLFWGIAFAGNTGKAQSAKINEYKQLKQLKAKSDMELKQMGYTSEEINRIRSIDYAQELRERAKLDNAQLKNLGYTDEQITMLKSFTGTEEEIIALAATLDLSAWHSSFWYDSANNRSYWRVSFSWTWSSMPVIRLTDVVGAGWGPQMSLVAPESWQTVRYVHKITGNGYTQDFAITLYAVNTAQVKFPMDSSDAAYWAKYGSGQVKVSYGGDLRDAQMRIAYGHNEFGVSPSVNVPWGVGFTFTRGVFEQDYGMVQLTR